MVLTVTTSICPGISKTIISFVTVSFLGAFVPSSISFLKDFPMLGGAVVTH